MLALYIEGLEVFFNDALLKNFISGVDDDVVPVDITKPTVFLIQVLIDGLAILVDRHWLPAQSICLLEVVFAA